MRAAGQVVGVVGVVIVIEKRGGTGRRLHGAQHASVGIGDENDIEGVAHLPGQDRPEGIVDGQVRRELLVDLPGRFRQQSQVARREVRALLPVVGVIRRSDDEQDDACNEERCPPSTRFRARGPGVVAVFWQRHESIVPRIRQTLQEKRAGDGERRAGGGGGRAGERRAASGVCGLLGWALVVATHVISGSRPPADRLFSTCNDLRQSVTNR